jgi:hypothetical protein
MDFFCIVGVGIDRNCVKMEDLRVGRKKTTGECL